jgi:plasmid replication initiation protein
MADSSKSKTTQVSGKQVASLSEAAKVLNGLSRQEINFLILQLLEIEKIDIPQVIAIYSEHLQDYKHKAQSDIRKLAEAGLHLSEKEIKKIKSIKADDKRVLHTAFAHTLLSAGYRGTLFHDKLSQHVDMSIVDKKWYDDCWRLDTVNDLASTDSETTTDTLKSAKEPS